MKILRFLQEDVSHYFGKETQEKYLQSSLDLSISSNNPMSYLVMVSKIYKRISDMAEEDGVAHTAEFQKAIRNFHNRAAQLYADKHNIDLASARELLVDVLEGKDVTSRVQPNAKKPYFDNINFEDAQGNYVYKAVVDNRFSSDHEPAPPYKYSKVSLDAIRYWFSPRPNDYEPGEPHLLKFILDNIKLLNIEVEDKGYYHERQLWFYLTIPKEDVQMAQKLDAALENDYRMRRLV